MYRYNCQNEVVKQSRVRDFVDSTNHFYSSISALFQSKTYLQDFDPALSEMAFIMQLIKGFSGDLNF